MAIERVVSNSSPLMNLAIIGKLDLLRELFGRMMVPQEVWSELTIEGKDKPGTEFIVQSDWIDVEPVGNRDLCLSLNRELDLGESAAIALAIEQQADLILLDETEARSIAEFHGLRKTGVLGVLMRAKHLKLIPEVRPLLDALRTEAHFWINPVLYNQVLAEMQEL